MFSQSPESRSAWRIGALLFGTLLLLPIGWIVFVLLYSEAKYVPSTIANFHPSDFSAVADKRFFFSIGDELKNAESLDPHAPTLLRGRMDEYLVSPDERMIAVVRSGELVIVGAQGSFLRVVTPVDSIYRDALYHKGIPIGRQFFRDSGFQWTIDSRNLYLIKDEFYQSQGSQLYSAKGELWKYDVESGLLTLVLKPFPAYEFFFGLKGVYFSVPTPAGDLHLRYFDGKTTKDVGAINAWEIPAKSLASGFEEKPFFSFSSRNFEAVALTGKDVRLLSDEKSAIQQLEVNGKTYLSMTRGEGMKGAFYCAERGRNLFLPGDRYLLFNFSCKNYEGQLLIDTQSGVYERLPADTRVYRTWNTVTHPRFRVTSGGMMDW